ncbi:hypothetical protein N9Y92_04100 [Chlamydiales bacterium]|nr:hypothetical protein [Chlamydiales bacterium]
MSIKSLDHSLDSKETFKIPMEELKTVIDSVKRVWEVTSTAYEGIGKLIEGFAHIGLFSASVVSETVSFIAGGAIGVGYASVKLPWAHYKYHIASEKLEVFKNKVHFETELETIGESYYPDELYCQIHEIKDEDLIEKFGVSKKRITEYREKANRVIENEGPLGVKRVHSDLVERRSKEVADLKKTRNLVIVQLVGAIFFLLGTLSAPIVPLSIPLFVIGAGCMLFALGYEPVEKVMELFEKKEEFFERSHEVEMVKLERTDLVEGLKKVVPRYDSSDPSSVWSQ